MSDCRTVCLILWSAALGAPQGTVLSPFLFSLYTSDFQFLSESCHLQKFADDSAIVGCVSEGKEEEYRSVVDSFIEWCATNHLLINPTKSWWWISAGGNLPLHPSPSTV